MEHPCLLVPQPIMFPSSSTEVSSAQVQGYHKFSLQCLPEKKNNNSLRV